LACDPDSSVREAVATHRNLPTRALTTLLTDASERVVRAAAASPTLPAPEMERLLVLAGL
jgi:leucine rich repeat (LRR) protein